MKNLKKKLILSVSLLLCALMLPISIASCKKQEIPEKEVVDPIFECGDSKLPLCFYEFMLSRMRGDLAKDKYDVKKLAFWEETQPGTSQTREEYFNAYVLNSCKNYFAAAVLFDRRGLTLSETKLAEIDEEIEAHIRADASGDLEKFNVLAANYGVDAESLRECYIIEAKYDAIVNEMYGGGALIGDAVKEEYYYDNYYRFKQVLFPKFYYEYKTDADGNVIYFDPETAKPVYDTENGEYKYNDAGNRVLDGYGEVVYYDEEGNILYDEKKGKPSVVVDENGVGVKNVLDADGLAKLKTRAEQSLSELTGKSHIAFDAATKQNESIVGYGDAYPDGFYLSDIESGGYYGDSAYLADILAALKEMSVGDVRLIESDFGYHVIMKYELDGGKFADGGYAEWFASLENKIINDMFLKEIKEILPEIVSIDENISKARSIKKLGTNYYY